LGRPLKKVLSKRYILAANKKTFTNFIKVSTFWVCCGLYVRTAFKVDTQSKYRKPQAKNIFKEF
jgi:hypothetical protein